MTRPGIVSGVSRSRDTSSRIETIDAVRGIALLGIFVINLPDMAYPEDLVLYPGPPGVLGTLDQWALVLSEAFFSGKMRGLFALIFGISAALYLEKLRQSRGTTQAAKVFCRRLLWLGAFGLFNAYILLWWGDILFQYAVLGFLLIPMLHLSWRALLGIVLACMVLLCLPPALEHREMLELRSDYETVQADLDAGRSVEDEDLDIVDDWEDAVYDLRPDFGMTADAVEARSGGYFDAVRANAPAAFDEQTVLFVEEGIADILLFMTLGVLLVRIGYVGPDGVRRVPVVWAVALLLFGMGLSAIAGVRSFEQPLDPVAVPFWLLVFEFGRLPLVLGYLAVLAVVLSRPGMIRYALAATGRMALTNYLMQSVIGLFLFQGFGLGLFNSLSRFDLVGILCLVWIGQIAFSVVWLRYFRQGPFEWLWRSLTNWEPRVLPRP